jgi:hypothetical protein
MKPTIFGATGATGTSLARQALADRGLATQFTSGSCPI